MDILAIISNSNNIIAFLTGVLVIITGYYAWQTRNLVQNTHLPVLKIYKTNISMGNDLAIGLKNIGLGYAKNIIGEITFKGKTSQIRTKSFNFKYTLLSPNNKIIMKHNFEDINRNSVKENYSQIILNCSYSDILGNKKKIMDIIDLGEEDIINMDFNSDQFREINHNLYDIKRAIEDLRRR